MKEEDIIRKLPQRESNPFRVPDGYFDDFAARLAARLTQSPRKKARHATRMWKYAAVLLVGCGAGLAFLLSSQRSDTLAAGDITEQYHEDYINDALDYALVSNSNIEIYLTEAY